MATSPKPYDNFWHYFRDVALALVTVVVGFLVADLIAEPFRQFTNLAYAAALCVGLFPFWWFTRRCHIHNYDTYDYVALMMFTLFAAVVRSALAGAIHNMIEILVIALAFGAFLGRWNWIRGQLQRQHQ